eukprot:TRINITY_DN4271_c1_g1_i1.p1 TRINITY_DN4271_c1_g1~~TRINITY_DN4271_c1_g1_i1.p1  ORF type:complete len:390 (+),score=197.94 TRINITY_DN4271_c1_g1_i1:129-1298(+)
MGDFCEISELEKIQDVRKSLQLELEKVRGKFRQTISQRQRSLENIGYPQDGDFQELATLIQEATNEKLKSFSEMRDLIRSVVSKMSHVESNVQLEIQVEKQVEVAEIQKQIQEATETKEDLVREMKNAIAAIKLRNSDPEIGKSGSDLQLDLQVENQVPDGDAELDANLKEAEREKIHRISELKNAIRSVRKLVADLNSSSRMASSIASSSNGSKSPHASPSPMRSGPTSPTPRIKLPMPILADANVPSNHMRWLNNIQLQLEDLMDNGDVKEVDQILKKKDEAIRVLEIQVESLESQIADHKEMARHFQEFSHAEELKTLSRDYQILKDELFSERDAHAKTKKLVGRAPSQVETIGILEALQSQLIQLSTSHASILLQLEQERSKSKK